MTAPLPAYVTAGTGPAVVLLHSSLSSRNQWKSLCALVENRYLTVAPDLYGYGDTPMPESPEGFTLFDEVDLVRSLLDEILPPGDTIHLVGHSYGGAVALAWCRRYPERVRSLTVFEPVAFHLLERDDPGLQEVVAVRRELERLLGEGRPDRAARTFVDYWSGAGTFDAYPPRLQKEFARRTCKLMLDFRALTQTLLTTDDYKSITTPVTLIAGRQSRLPSLRVAETLAQTLPSCKMVWVETGHMGPLTDPELLNPIITDSLS